MLYVHRTEKTTITCETLSKAVSYMGIDANDIKRASLSYTNDVFELTVGVEKRYLKFFTNQWCDKASGSREIETAKMIRSLGIKTPEVLYFGNGEGLTERNFALYSALPGVPLITLLPNQVNFKFIQESIGVLKKMALVKGDFGFIEHDQKIHKTYTCHFDFINDTVFYSFKKLKDLGYEVGNLPVLYEEWRLKDANCSKFTLCHNDFTPKHVFIDKSNNFSGLIDFEWAVYSSAVSDGALWLTSLAEYDQDEDNLKLVINYCKSIDEHALLPYLVARKLILAASWPHKRVVQPYYSRTCLNKAEQILNKKFICFDDLLWGEKLGIETLENGNEH